MTSRQQSSETPTDEPLTDPETLRTNETVTFIERTDPVDADRFEAAQSIEGLIVVGVVDSQRRVLLITLEDHPREWRLPGGLIDSDVDWLAAARRGVSDRIGLDVHLDGVEAVHRIENRLETDPEQSTTTYDVVVRASPDGTVSDATNLTPDEEIDDVRWFDEWPVDVCEQNEALLRTFLEPPVTD